MDWFPHVLSCSNLHETSSIIKHSETATLSSSKAYKICISKFLLSLTPPRHSGLRKQQHFPSPLNRWKPYLEALAMSNPSAFAFMVTSLGTHKGTKKRHDKNRAGAVVFMLSKCLLDVKTPLKHLSLLARKCIYEQLSSCTLTELSFILQCTQNVHKQ